MGVGGWMYYIYCYIVYSAFYLKKQEFGSCPNSNFLLLMKIDSYKYCIL